MDSASLQYSHHFWLWPLLLGTALNMTFWSNWEAVIAMFVVVIVVCLVNASVALTSSLFTEKTSIALLTTYSILLLLYVGPPAAVTVMEILNFSPDNIATWNGQESQVHSQRYLRSRWMNPETGV